jgi:hypothetical protein
LCSLSASESKMLRSAAHKTSSSTHLFSCMVHLAVRRGWPHDSSGGTMRIDRFDSIHFSDLFDSIHFSDRFGSIHFSDFRYYKKIETNGVYRLSTQLKLDTRTHTHTHAHTHTHDVDDNPSAR